MNCLTWCLQASISFATTTARRASFRWGPKPFGALWARGCGRCGPRGGNVFFFGGGDVSHGALVLHGGAGLDFSCNFDILFFLVPMESP